MKLLPLLIIGTVFTTKVYAQDDEMDEEMEDEGEVEVNDDGEAEVEEPTLSPEQQAEIEIQMKEQATGIRDPSSHPGRIVFRKKLLTMEPAVGVPLEVEYSVYNVGNTDVTEVRVDDTTWSTDDFSDAAEVNFYQESIAPGKSYTHKITLTPIREGELKLQTPKISYKSTRDGKDATEHEGEGATQGLVKVLSRQYYQRNIASQYMNWLVFLVVCAPSTVFPYMAAENIMNKYSKQKTA